MGDARTPSLERFIRAQAPVFEQVLAELRAGRKRTHWMWFVFPQIRGLGHSPTAQHYAIGSLEEAEAYLRHPLLGERLRLCTRLVSDIEGRAIGEIFSDPDPLKFRSCMTLFARAAERRAPSPEDQIFRRALEQYFAGEEDLRTLERLPRGPTPERP